MPADDDDVIDECFNLIVSLISTLSLLISVLCCFLIIFGIVGGVGYHMFHQSQTVYDEYLLLPANTTFKHSVTSERDTVVYTLINGERTGYSSIQFTVDYEDKCFVEYEYEDRLVSVQKECYLKDNYNRQSSCFILRYWPGNLTGNQDIKVSCDLLNTQKQSVYAVWKLLPVEQRHNDQELQLHCPSDWGSVNYQKCNASENVVGIENTDEELLLLLRFCGGSHDNHQIMKYFSSFNQPWIPNATAYSRDSCSRYRMTNDQTQVSISLHHKENENINIYITTNGKLSPTELKVEFSGTQDIIFHGYLANFVTTSLTFCISTILCCTLVCYTFKEVS